MLIKFEIYIIILFLFQFFIYLFIYINFFYLIYFFIYFLSNFDTMELNEYNSN